MGRDVGLSVLDIAAPSRRREDPGLATPRADNAVVQVAVGVVVLVVVLPSTWAATLIAIVFTAVPTGLVVHAAGRERRERESRGT